MIHTCTYNCFTVRTTRITRVNWYQKKHSPTHTYRGHQSSLICFLHLLQSMASSLLNLCALQSFSQSLSKFSLVYFLAWHPPLHTPYISSPNHCFLFTVHTHTIATCFAVVPRLCHLILVSLSTLSLAHLQTLRSWIHQHPISIPRTTMHPIIAYITTSNMPIHITS